MLKTPGSFVSLLKAQPHPAPSNFIFRNEELLVREADLALADNAASDALGLASTDYFPVGLLAQRYCRSAWVPATTGPQPGFAFRKLRSLFGAMDEELLAVAGRAFQIADWARSHRHCGACGSTTLQVDGERCVKCPQCALIAYPRISPAMMVLIQRGDAILLARHTNSPTAFFTALAGFLEAGESIEEAVHREVYEEVGLRVRDLAYFGSQPWPFPHSLMIAFTAQYESGEIRVDQSEIAEARWFGPNDPMPRTPPRALSIAGHLIHAHLPQHAD